LKKDCKVKYLAYSLLQNVGQAHEEVENYKFVFYRRDPVERRYAINDFLSVASADSAVIKHLNPLSPKKKRVKIRKICDQKKKTITYSNFLD
jgi:hypothetical protein